MALTLARSRTTRHLTLSRLLSTAPPPTPPLPSSPLLNRPSLTPLSQTVRSFSSFLAPKPTQPPSPPPPPISSLSHTVRSIHSSPTVRSIETPSSFRPLSPHLAVYNTQLSSTLSILNRISSVILTAVVLGFYLLYVKSGQICFTFNNFYNFLFYSSKLSLVTLEITALALAYHILIGFRHLADDLGGIKKRKAVAAAALFLIVSLGFLFAYSPMLNSGSNFTQMEGLPAALLVGSGSDVDPEHKDNGGELFVKGSSKTT